MSKPDDVSQSAWDATDTIGEAIYGRHERGFVMWPLVDSVAMRPAIARAIDAATKAEREACVVAIKECEPTINGFHYTPSTADYIDAIRSRQ